MLRLIVITAPNPLPDEARALTALLEAGVDRLHLRKPVTPESELEALVGQIPERFLSRISFHDRFELALRCGAGGVHLNARNPIPPEGFGGTVSRSCHSLDELALWSDRYDYLFLSPLFDSLSKQGYRAGFAPEALRDAARRGLIGSRTVALGGMEPDRLAAVGDLGFGGAAVLGYLWNDYRNADDLPALCRRFDRLLRAAR